MSTSFRHFSVDEVQSGLRYASEEHRIELDRDTLRRLANDTGNRWYTGGRRRGLLLQAKRECLNEDLWIRSRCDADRRNAYSSAISKIFSERARLARLKRRPKLAERATVQSVDPNVYGFDSKGRGVFLFPGMP